MKINRIYPVRLPVQYETQGQEPLSGEGQSLAVSRGVVRFECGRPLPCDEKIRLVLAWPASLPDGTGLNLWVLGTVTECMLGAVEVSVSRYEFRTRRSAQQACSSREGRKDWFETFPAAGR